MSTDISIIPKRQYDSVHNKNMHQAISFKDLACAATIIQNNNNYY